MPGFAPPLQDDPLPRAKIMIEINGRDYWVIRDHEDVVEWVKSLLAPGTFLVEVVDHLANGQIRSSDKRIG